MPTLADLGHIFDPAAEGARRASEEIGSLETRVRSLATNVSQQGSQMNHVLDALTQGMNGIRNEISPLVAALQQLTNQTNQNRQRTEQTANTVEDMYNAYRQMGIEIQQLNLNMKTLEFTQKEINKVVTLGTDYNNQRADAYENLSRKYSALKILINNMTLAERESTQEGRALVAQAREMYEQMNVLQQRTGKYTLQVGDYSKAMTGLNIATTQVIRELPVLANGAAQFAIAISNNLPILIDNIQAVTRQNEALTKHKQELLADAEAARINGDAARAMEIQQEAAAIKTTTALKGLVTTLFSWQTLIVVLLSVLPNLIRKMEEKKKAAKETADATKELLKETMLLIDAYASIDKAVVDNTTKLKVLNAVAQDELRSREDRIAAARAMKQEYEDELANVTEEEIIMGRAKTAIDNLTESLIIQARARAYMNQITELQEKIIEEDTKKKKLLAEQEERLAQSTAHSNESNRDRRDRIRRESEAFQTELQQLQDADANIAELENTIKRLISEIPTEGLLEFLTGGGRSRGAQETLANLGNYYFDWLESIYGLTEDEREKDYQLLSLQYDREIATWKQKLADEEATGLLSVEQRRYLNEIIVNLEKEKVKALEDLLNKQHADQLEADRKANEAAAKAEAKNAKKIMDTRNNDAKAYYQNSILEKRALLRNEIDYWNEYLQILRDRGLLTFEEYSNIMSKINKAKDEMAKAHPETIWDLIGMARNVDISKDAQRNLDKTFNTAIDYMYDWMDARIQMAEIAVEAAQKETEATKTALEYEMEARANGYANSVEYARKEYEKKLELEKKAVQEQERLQKIQEQIDTATQISSLITATAELWKSMSGAGAIGAALAIAATATMWGSFTAAKVKAYQLAGARSKTYGEGGMEYLDYGGSHASGHDIDFGVMKDGTQRRVERGEIVGVINKRNVAKYGVKEIGNIIESLNHGTFEDKYGLSYVASAPADLSKLESGIDTLISQGSRRVIVTNSGVIEYYKNSKRIIRA